MEEKTDVSLAFSRTRADHAIEILEDYTEAIAEIGKETGGCRVMDLARYFGVSHVSVIQVLQRLEAHHFIKSGARKPMQCRVSGLSDLNSAGVKIPAISLFSIYTILSAIPVK